MDRVKIPDDTLDFFRSDGGVNPYANTMTTHQMFSEVLDTFGKPTRRF